MISISSVKDCFFYAMGDGSCLVKWGLGVMGLPGCMEVECLDVSSSMGFGILFGANYHAVTPRDRFAYQDWFHDAKTDILIKVIRQGLVMGNGGSLWLINQLHGWAVHHRLRLMLTQC